MHYCTNIFIYRQQPRAWQLTTDVLCHKNWLSASLQLNYGLHVFLTVHAYVYIWWKVTIQFAVSPLQNILRVSYTYLTGMYHSTFLYFPANGEVRLVQQSPLGLPCPGSEVIFQCTLPDTAVIWSFLEGELTLIPSSSEAVTGNFRARPVGVISGNFTSTLTFTAENRTVITCNNRDRSRSDSVTITVQGIEVFMCIIWDVSNVMYKALVDARVFAWSWVLRAQDLCFLVVQTQPCRVPSVCKSWALDWTMD